MTSNMSGPRQYLGVMVSSTFEDLREHRAALMRAIQGQQLFVVAMESGAARPLTVIESSLERIRDAAAYIAIISHRYGSIPEFDTNPDGLSLTHLEFREAVRLGLPIVVFIMGQEHLVTASSVEFDPEKRNKLSAFRDEVKLSRGDVRLVIREFNDLADFATGATQALAELRRVLKTPDPRPAPLSGTEERIPAAPALYARPRYLGSHSFVGRDAQLETLSDWARPAGWHTIMLIEAIGGTGKSMLSWEWTTRHAQTVRGDWAGRFWYSFYETGAAMSDFCRRALAYMSGKPLTTFSDSTQQELTELLIQQLESKPWLLVLDGLERVLVAYNRYDAARVGDEYAGALDEIADRVPNAAIRPEDDDLLRRLAGASPSKVLITSRLVPRVLLNLSSQVIPGVLHERLQGLRPAEAEAMLRGCGVVGESSDMRSFLKRHCDCHPLVVGLVAGLVNDYLPARGDFDRWAADPRHGGSLDVGELDLVQKRNHILHTATATLSDSGERLLRALSLLSESVDHSTLVSLGLFESSESASRDLAFAVTDLERRGLLRYDRSAGHYDLHPVVRAVAMGSMGASEREWLGNRVATHLSGRKVWRYQDVTSLAELRDVMTQIRTLAQMGQKREACNLYSPELEEVLRTRFEAVPEILALLAPFFDNGWSSPSRELSNLNAWRFSTYAGSALEKLGHHEQAMAASVVSLRLSVKLRHRASSVTSLSNLTLMLDELNQFAACRRTSRLNLDLAARTAEPADLLVARAKACRWLYAAGRIAEAEEMWRGVSTEHSGSRDTSVQCEAELDHARFQFDRGMLTEDVLSQLEDVGQKHRLRQVVRETLALRGAWLAERGDWASAVAALGESVRMAGEAGCVDTAAETRLALCRFRLGQLTSPSEAISRLAAARNPDHLGLARLWLAVGNAKRATDHAFSAYRWAWADGEPYVRRFDLERAKQFLEELGEQAPVLSSYDPAKDPELPWEAEVRAFMDTLRD